MKSVRRIAAVLILAGTVPAWAVDANSLVNGTIKDWFYTKSNITLQAAQIMVARDRNAHVSANDLWQCINEVAVDENAGSQKVAEVAALCIVTMNGGR